MDISEKEQTEKDSSPNYFESIDLGLDLDLDLDLNFEIPKRWF